MKFLTGYCWLGSWTYFLVTAVEISWLRIRPSAKMVLLKITISYLETKKDSIAFSEQSSWFSSPTNHKLVARPRDLCEHVAEGDISFCETFFFVVLQRWGEVASRSSMWCDRGAVKIELWRVLSKRVESGVECKIPAPAPRAFPPLRSALEDHDRHPLLHSYIFRICQRTTNFWKTNSVEKIYQGWLCLDETWQAPCSTSCSRSIWNTVGRRSF